jgi:hypothetical protein
MVTHDDGGGGAVVVVMMMVVMVGRALAIRHRCRRGTGAASAETKAIRERCRQDDYSPILSLERTRPMRTTRASILIAFLTGGCISLAGVAVAQPAPPGASQRDCQTVRTCNFSRGGLYRGCLSSYTCRVCRPVATSCRVGGGPRRVCQEMRCNWG